MPDRWQAYANALAKVGIAGGAVVVVIGGAFTLPLLLVQLLGLLAGCYPARRRIFGESWGLGGFLGHVLRFPVAVVALWIVLAAAPATIAGLEPWQLPAATTIAVALAVWILGMGTFLRRIMQTRPVEGAAVTGRFQQLLSRSEVLSRGRQPVLLQAGPRGGIWAGHFGMPSRRPYVVVSDLLLEKLDPDELSALLAHDLASIEQARRDGNFWRELRFWLLLAFSVACVPLAEHFAPSVVPVIPCFWFLITMVAFGRAAIRNNQLVPQLDRRAVELSGDPEALVRALTKVHVLSNTPGRWDQNCDRAAAHPSLASRIQAIRQAAGFATQVLDVEVVLESSEPGRYAIIGPEQVWFLDGVAAGDTDAAALRQRATSSRAFAYRSLQSLQVKVGIGGAGVLAAATDDHQQMRLPLAPASVARAQSALDAVEAKLTVPVAGRSAAEAMGAVAGLLLLIASFFPGLPALAALPGLQVLRRRTFAPLLAAGAVAVLIGGAGMAGAFCGQGCGPTLLISSALALAAGIALLASARRLARLAPDALWRDYRDTVGVLTFGTLIALPFAISLATLPAESRSMLQGLQIAGPAFALALAILVVARYSKSLWARALALLLVLAALAPTVLGLAPVQRLLGI